MDWCKALTAKGKSGELYKEKRWKKKEKRWKKKEKGWKKKEKRWKKKEKMEEESGVVHQYHTLYLEDGMGTPMSTMNPGSQLTEWERK